VSSFTSILTTEPFYPGTKSLALDSTGELALFGGVDGIAGVYSIPQKQLLDPLKAEDGAINDVAWAGKKSITATSSGVVRIWSEDSSESTAISTHAGDVVALAVHPSESLFASAGADKSWVLYDLETTKSVAQVYDKNSM
jgi:pre-mRNA-processing factor 19